MNEKMLNRRQFVGQTLAASAAGAMAGIGATAGPPDKGPRTKPNIILILTDDQGYGDVGFNGNKIIKTPNLDRFARENVVFDRFYVDPVCTPTRAALMTGRHPYRVHITWVGQRLPADEMTLAEALKHGGYATACYGKWGNLGTHYPRRAIDRGFDEAVVHLKGQFSPPQNKTGYFDPILWRNGKISKNKTINKGDKVCVFEDIILPKGKVNFRPTFFVAGKTVVGGRNDDGNQQGPIHVTFERLG